MDKRRKAKVTKSEVIKYRATEQDRRQLEKVVKQMGTGTISQTIRHLVSFASQNPSAIRV